MHFIQDNPTLLHEAFQLSQSDNTQSLSSTSSLSIQARNQQSKDDTSWPFLCVCINFTKESLQLLRKGVLNNQCNKQLSVINVICDFHKALIAEFIR